MTGRVSIKPSDVGKRVTVQFFDETGDRQEAVGNLERVDVVDGQPTLAIRRKDDSLVTVPLKRINAGKVVQTR